MHFLGACFAQLQKPFLPSLPVCFSVDSMNLTVSCRNQMSRVTRICASVVHLLLSTAKWKKQAILLSKPSETVSSGGNIFKEASFKVGAFAPAAEHGDGVLGFPQLLRTKFVSEFHVDGGNSWLGERALSQTEAPAQVHSAGQKQQQETWCDAVDWFTESWLHSYPAQLQSVCNLHYFC